MKPGKLVIIEPNGNRLNVGYPDKPSLKNLQDAVGGYIERVRVRVDGRVRDGYVNEDGIAQELPVNFPAMQLLAPPFDQRVNTLLGNLAVWIPDPTNKS